MIQALHTHCSIRCFWLFLLAYSPHFISADYQYDDQSKKQLALSNTKNWSIWFILIKNVDTYVPLTSKGLPETNPSSLAGTFTTRLFGTYATNYITALILIYFLLHCLREFHVIYRQLALIVLGGWFKIRTEHFDNLSKLLSRVFAWNLKFTSDLLSVVVTTALFTNTCFTTCCGQESPIIHPPTSVRSIANGSWPLPKKVVPSYLNAI